MHALPNQAGQSGRQWIGRSRARMDLAAVEAALHRMQQEFDAIHARLSARRDPMDDRVIANLVAGYAFVDTSVAEGADLFAMGNLRRLLELNTLVLCGTSRDRREAYAAHTEATERRFYEERDGGIRDV